MQLPEGDIQEYYAHAVVFCIRHFCTSFYIFIFAYHFNMFCAYLYVRMSLSDKTDYTYVLSILLLLIFIIQYTIMLYKKVNMINTYNLIIY